MPKRFLYLGVRDPEPGEGAQSGWDVTFALLHHPGDNDDWSDDRASVAPTKSRISEVGPTNSETKTRDQKLKRHARRMGWEVIKFREGRYGKRPYILVDSEGVPQGPMTLDQAEEVIHAINN
jgi:hypothetical protein